MTNETTASQPKSIWDDAQFLAHWDSVAHEYGANAFGVAYKAARAAWFAAPAAQASATIQAAPIYGYHYEWASCITTAGPQNFKWVFDREPPPEWAVEDGQARNVTRLYTNAATIQEPVMVAEPVGASEQESTAEHPLIKLAGEIFGFKYWKTDEEQRAKYLRFASEAQKLAAPMVSDPAGVTPEMIQWRNIRKVILAVADFCFGSKDDPVYGASHCAVTTCLTAKDGLQVKLEPLAATVKAVPSEALSEKEINFVKLVIACPGRKLSGDGESMDYGDDAEIMALWKRPEQRGIVEVLGSYKWRANPELVNAIEKSIRQIIANFAAPLADKTGGGA